MSSGSTVRGIQDDTPLKLWTSPFDDDSGLRAQQHYRSTFHQSADILKVSTGRSMNMEIDIVHSHEARGVQIPPDLAVPSSFEGNSAQIPTATATSRQSLVSETLNLAAGRFRGSFRQNILRTAKYLQELDNELQHTYPGQNEVREDLLALATGACKLQRSTASEWRVHVILQKKMDPSVARRQRQNDYNQEEEEEMLVGRNGMPPFLGRHYLLFSPTLQARKPNSGTQSGEVGNNTRANIFMAGALLAEALVVSEEECRFQSSVSDQPIHGLHFSSQPPCAWFPGQKYGPNTLQGKQDSPHLEIGREACRAIQSIPFHKTERYYRSFIRDLRHWLVTVHHRRAPPFSYRQMTPSWIRRRLKLALSVGEGDQGQSALFLEFDGKDVDMPSANGQANRNRRQKRLMKALLAAFHQCEPATQPLLKYIIEHGGHRQYHGPSQRRRIPYTNQEEITSTVQPGACSNRRTTERLENRAVGESTIEDTHDTEEKNKQADATAGFNGLGASVNDADGIQMGSLRQRAFDAHETRPNDTVPMSHIAQRADQAQRRVAALQSLQQRGNIPTIPMPPKEIAPLQNLPHKNPETNLKIRRLQETTHNWESPKNTTSLGGLQNESQRALIVDDGKRRKTSISDGDPSLTSLVEKSQNIAELERSEEVRDVFSELHPPLGTDIMETKELASSGRSRKRRCTRLGIIIHGHESTASSCREYDTGLGKESK